VRGNAENSFHAKFFNLMASNAKKITVNCGTTHVSVSVFSEKAGSLVLEKFVIEDLVYDYTAEEEWSAAATGALTRIFKSLKMKGVPATVIAPGHLLLTKNVKVPQVEASKQNQIIEFEASNKFPFPLSELVWDSQIVSTDGYEAEVVLFALKRDVAERFASEMLRTGISPEVVQPATNLDYQAYHFVHAENPENVLIVNVGARTTNLTFVTPNGFSVQNIAVGGNLLTQTIADTLGKPFAAAERFKVNYFSGMMDVSEDDPHVLKIRENAQAFCRRFCQEITRRIVNQKRQNADATPVKILLTGRGSQLPGLAEALAETQHLPVEFFEVTAPVLVDDDADATAFDAARYQLSEVVGDATELLGSSAKQVNLLPEQIASAIAFSKKKPVFFIAAALIAIAPWIAFFGLKSAGDNLAKEDKVISAERKTLDERRKAIDALEEENLPEINYVETLDGVLAARGCWNAFLADLQERISSLQKPTISDDGEKTFPRDRHIWVDAMRANRSVKVASVGDELNEDEKPARTVRTEVELTLRMLIPEVDGAKPEHNASAFNRRRKAVLDAFSKSPFVEKVSDQPSFSQPNVPALTLKLVLKPDQGL